MIWCTKRRAVVADSPTYRMHCVLYCTLYRNPLFIWMNHRKDMHNNMDLWILFITLYYNSFEYWIVCVLFHVSVDEFMLNSTQLTLSLSLNIHRHSVCAPTWIVFNWNAMTFQFAICYLLLMPEQCRCIFVMQRSKCILWMVYGLALHIYVYNFWGLDASICPEVN